MHRQLCMYSIPGYTCHWDWATFGMPACAPVTTALLVLVSQCTGRVLVGGGDRLYLYNNIHAMCVYSKHFQILTNDDTLDKHPSGEGPGKER